jgi:Flp pilus assembly protein TadD
MDKAVLFAPDNPEIRLVRGINSLNIPDQFGRLPIALEDFEALEAMNPEKLSVLGERGLTEFHFSYGLALVRNGNKPKAILQFRRVLETAPSSPRAETARKQLALLEKS